MSYGYGVFGDLTGGVSSAMTRQPDPTTTPQPLRPAGWGGHHARPIATSIFGGGVYQGDAVQAQSLQPTPLNGLGAMMAPPRIVPRCPPGYIWLGAAGCQHPAGQLHGFGAYVVPGPPNMPIHEMAPRQIAITHPAMQALPIGRATVAYGEYMMAPGYSGFGGLTGFGS